MPRHTELRSATPRAEVPRPPNPTPGLLQELAKRDAYLRERRSKEQRVIWRGLVLLAAVALFFGLVHAGWGRAFYAGWWKQW